MDIVTRAREIAHRAHAGQVDKAGKPYIEHVARVAAACADDPVAGAVAWLHDVAEDHPRYYARIGEIMPPPVVIAVQLLDRNVAGDYYGRIRANHVAIRVKLADIADNADELRLALLDPATADRLRRKYAEARRALGGE
jgi:(p)ppGpp synthase/HD superfamily hydrolase